MTLVRAWREHWPEYLIEGWALGTFMLSASVVVVLLESRQLPFHELVPSPLIRRMLVGMAMGLTALALIYSRWGRQSGAHMNPAVTLAFLRLGLVRSVDGAFYILSQVVGGVLGVLGGIWTAFWVYLLAPPLGMVAAAQVHHWQSGGRLNHCAKLCHDGYTRCIHCGYTPSKDGTIASTLRLESPARRSHV
jgi:glycerol uptake facilitator-like aquaporin